MNRLRILPLLVITALLLTTACDGCGACSRTDVDADAEKRLSELAGALPADTEAALVAPDLGELAQTLDYAFGRMEHFDPDARAAENQINQMLGFRITDIESWDAAGFAPNSSIIFAMVDGRPVMTGYIDDKNAFQTHVIGRMRRTTETSVAIQDETYGEREFQISGNPPVSDMAWYYEGSQVVLIFPPLEALRPLISNSAAEVAEVLGGVDADSSLAAHEGFAEFRRGVGDDYPVSLYAEAESIADETDLEAMPMFITGFGPLLQAMMKWSQNQAGGTGIGFRAGDQRLELRAFAAGDEDLMEEARAAQTTAVETGWDGMLTENTTIAARTSFDLSGAVDAFLESLPDEERQQAERELDQAGPAGLNLREDILEALSGHSLLVFYGVGGDIDSAVRPLTQGRIGTGLRIALANSGLLFSLHFADADKLQVLLDAANEAGSEFVERRPLEVDGQAVDGFEVFQPLDLSMAPFRAFITEQSITFAASGIGESAAHQYLTDAREESRLADVEGLALGNAFAESDNVNGLYVNFANIRSNMRNIPFMAGYANAIRMVHELLMTAGVDDHGFYVTTQLDFSDPLEDDGDQ